MKFIFLLFFQLYLCENVKKIINCLKENNICFKNDINQLIKCIGNEIKSTNLINKNEYFIDESEINLFCEYIIYKSHENLLRNNMTHNYKNIIDDIIIGDVQKLNETNKTIIIIMITAFLLFLVLIL